MTILGISNIGLSYGDRPILTDITFAVNEGDRVGVIGENGAGKTTLFNIICGTLPQDSGTVSLPRNRTVGLLRQQVDLSECGQMTLLEYMYAAFPEQIEREQELQRLEYLMTTGTAPSEAARVSAAYDRLSVLFKNEGGIEWRARCRSMLTHLGFSETEQSRLISTLSGGQHTRLALARLLAREPDLLLLDEPTNHLDIDALQWLEEFISSYRKTVMVISHDRYFLDRTTTHTLEIERNRATMYKGSYSAAKEKRQADEASRERRRREQQKIRERIEANIAFQRRCGQEHNFVTIRSKQKQLDRMERIAETRALRTISFEFSSLPDSPNDVLRVKGLSFGYSPSRLLFDDVSFLVQKGERVLVLGGNGTGKSTLMRVLCNLLPPTSGWVEHGYGVQVGYYDQEMRGLDPMGTVLGELEKAYPDRPVRELRSALAHFLFTADDIDRPVSSLSGGERARLLLCKLMQKRVNLLIMDEPTNHLDIASREMLETALSEFEGTVIAVSHDRYFIDRVASRIFELAPADEGGLMDYRLDEGEGAYTSYLRMRTPPRQSEAPKDTAPSETKLDYEQQKKARAEEQARKRKIKHAERRVPELEAEIAELTAKINDAGSDYMLLSRLQQRQEEAEAELLELYELLL